MLNTDKAPTYAAAIAEFKAEGKCPDETRRRQVKYLNNVVEADHGKLKLLLRPVRGFKTLKTAYATIKGFEVMRALRKGQARAFALQGGIIGEARIVERAFGVGPCALTEVPWRCCRTIWPTQNHEATPRSARPPHAFVRFATEPEEVSRRSSRLTRWMPRALRPSTVSSSSRNVRPRRSSPPCGGVD